MSYDVVVIGGGPAGLSAALNVRARGRSVLVVTNPPEENPLWKAERVDNYLGMPGLSGAELLEQLRRHAEAAGAEFRTGKVLSAMPMEDTWYLSIGTDMEHARALVLAAGVNRGKKFPGETEFLGRGVSYCATCDGMLYRGKPVAVLGYTPTARHEAEFLEGIGCSVTYFERPASCTIRGGSQVEEITCDGKTAAVAYHGSHGAVSGAGCGKWVRNGGPAHGDQSSRRLCRRRLHRRTAPGVQGHRRRAGGGPECRSVCRCHHAERAGGRIINLSSMNDLIQTKERKNYNMAMQHFKTAEFDAAVEAAPLAMVDFWAEWCGPCKMLSPVIEELAQEFDGKVLVGKVNVDEEPELARRFGVMTIPTVVFLKNGKEVERKVGAMPAAVFRGVLDKHLG